MEFFTKYVRPERVGEKVDHSSITEQAGYMTTEQMVRRFMDAGERLMAYKKEQFDYAEEEEVPPDVAFDPTRDPGFDPADADALRVSLVRKLEAQPVQEAAPGKSEEAQEPPVADVIAKSNLPEAVKAQLLKGTTKEGEA